VALHLVPDRNALAGDGSDALPVTVEALDAQGRHVPTANLPVEFDIRGPGAIIGVGNGNPNSHEPEQGNERSLFNGLAQVIIQSERGGSGNLVLRARTANLKSAETAIRVESVTPPAAVGVVPNP
jgi:beta-galactosidase